MTVSLTDYRDTHKQLPNIIVTQWNRPTEITQFMSNSAKAENVSFTPSTQEDT